MAEGPIEETLPLIVGPDMVDTNASFFYRRKYRPWKKVVFIVNSNMAQGSEQGDWWDVCPATKFHQMVKEKDKDKKGASVPSPIHLVTRLLKKIKNYQVDERTITKQAI